MRVGGALLELARETGAPSLFIVGTGKNVGKTVAMRAIYEAACDAGIVAGLASIGRDGEAVDAGDAAEKPRLWLRPGTVIATARDVLPESPASELLATAPHLRSAAGSLLFARVKSPAHYELIGPPTASGIRECTNSLLQHADYAIVDGAVDRVAALAGGVDAVVVSCGAGSAATPEEAVEDVRALVARLRIPPYDGHSPCIRIDGALTAAGAAALLARREARDVVLADPTRFVVGGRAASTILQRLRVRCERTLRVVGVTVASAGRDRSFEPLSFARDVAAATSLPVFDVYAGSRAAA